MRGAAPLQRGPQHAAGGAPRALRLDDEARRRRAVRGIRGRGDAAAPRALRHRRGAATVLPGGVVEREHWLDVQLDHAEADGGETFVDVTAPHPEFILAPPTSRLSAKEIDDILLELKRDTQGREELKPTHILVRALRRGFAIYIEDAAFSVYRRVVQRLAQQGKLAIVFSDVSLAYGVNMPFRTVMFCGCLLYTSPSPRDVEESRMPSSA